MNDKLRGIITGVCTLVELGCIGALVYIGLKRNNDAYNAEMKCISLEVEKFGLEVENACLKADIKQLKKEQEVTEEEA